jgi:hypothetical protein
MDKIRSLVREALQQVINESILADKIEMSPAEFRDFVKAYQRHVDSNAEGNAVLTIAKESWEDEGLAYVGYIKKNDVHFRYFPESLEFNYDPSIIQKPFIFVHKGGGSPTSGKVKED